MTRSCTAAMRIRHPSIDPDEITRRLGIEPLHCWRAGDVRAAEPDELGGGVHRETYWIGLLPSLLKPQSSGRLGPVGRLLAASVSPSLDSPELLISSAYVSMWRERDFWRRFTDEGGTVDVVIERRQCGGLAPGSAAGPHRGACGTAHRLVVQRGSGDARSGVTSPA